MRIANIVLAAAFSLGWIPCSSAQASDKSDVMAAVKKFDDAFNKGDAKGIVAACTPQALIIDDFPPHTWQGADTCANWASALDAYDKQSGIVAGPVTIGKPWHVAITGDKAYVVVPAKYVYTQNGKKVVESGSNWTLVLQKGATGWLISAWSWAQH